MDSLNNNHIDVLRVFFKSGDPTLKDIIAYSGLSIEDATLATRELVRGGMVRMKDNDLERGWSYALTSCGREQRDTHCAANPPIKAFVAADVTPEDIEAVEDAQSHAHGAWDMVPPAEIIAAAWNRLIEKQARAK